jgi:hypothetical protein
MLKIICLSNHINFIRVNIIVFFSLFLLLGFQCLFDFLNEDISEINNIKKYAILFIIISIIGILCSCLICDDDERDNIINKRDLININEGDLININEMANRERERLV